MLGYWPSLVASHLYISRVCACLPHPMVSHLALQAKGLLRPPRHADVERACGRWVSERNSHLNTGWRSLKAGLPLSLLSLAFSYRTRSPTVPPEFAPLGLSAGGGR